MIDAYGKAKDIPNMVKLYETMKMQGIAPNIYTYNSMIDALGKSKDIKNMMDLFQAIHFPSLQIFRFKLLLQ
jgi:pentatricopeptide repeat protein